MGTPAADDLWAKVSAAVRAQLSEATWNTWFQGVHALELTEEQMTEVEAILEKIEDDDDVQVVFTNLA